MTMAYIECVTSVLQSMIVCMIFQDVDFERVDGKSSSRSLYMFNIVSVMPFWNVLSQVTGHSVEYGIFKFC